MPTIKPRFSVILQTDAFAPSSEVEYNPSIRVVKGASIKSKHKKRIRFLKASLLVPLDKILKGKSNLKKIKYVSIETFVMFLETVM